MEKLVMIIDDSPVMRKIIEASLRREGIHSMSFADGFDALRALSEHHDLVPDLVLLDVSMPKVDGYQVAHLLKVRPRFKNTVIIMLSGHDGKLDYFKGRIAGASVYLTKPFKMRDMLAAVHRYLDTPSKLVNS